MRKIAKALLEIANELDSLGFFKEANEVDRAVEDVAKIDNPFFLGDKDLVKIQAAINKYIDLEGKRIEEDGAYVAKVQESGKDWENTYISIRNAFPTWFKDRNIRSPIKFKTKPELLKLLLEEVRKSMSRPKAEQKPGSAAK